MITMNGPFIIALAILISLIVIKWIEWYLFKNGTIKRRPRKDVVSKKDTKRSDFGRKLKGFLFFGKAELKRPWYGGIAAFVFLLSNQFFIAFLDFEIWQVFIYLVLALILIAWLEIFILIRANKDFFSVEEQKKRFIKTQIRQNILCILLVTIFATVLGVNDFESYQPDPPGLKESVEWSIEPVYEGNWPAFREGLAAVGKKSKKGFINKNGDIVIPFQYKDAGNFCEGLAAVKKGKEWGYLDQTGNVKITFQYEEAGDFSEGLAPVKKDGKWMVIDKLGLIRFQTDYERIYPFHEGVAIVEIQDRQYHKLITTNLIDTRGRLLFIKGYAFNGDFNEGCISVMDAQSGKGYFLDRTEKKGVPVDFLDAGSFSGGYAPVWLENGEYALIDHAGTIIRKLSEKEYYSYRNFSEGLSSFTEGDWEKNTLRYGFKDLYGNIIIPAMFQDVTSSSDGMIGLTVDGLWGFMENPLPMAAREIDTELWAADRTQIGTVEGLPIFAGELESCAYNIKQKNPAADGSTIYRQAFEQIKLKKAAEKFGHQFDPETILYQIGDNYYKKLLLESS